MSSDSDPSPVRVKRERSETPLSTPERSFSKSKAASTKNDHHRRSNGTTAATTHQSPIANGGSSSGASNANAELLRRVDYRHQASINQLLAKRPDLQLIDVGASAAAGQLAAAGGNADDGGLLGADEEIWMFQCASNVNVEQLLGAKLSLNGQRKTVRPSGSAAAAAVGLEYQSEEARPAGGETASKVLLFRRSGRKHKHALAAFRPVGTVRVHEEIQEQLIADIEPAKRVTVPYPSGLKVRHPLHGVDYEKRTNLSGEVKRQLRSAVRASAKGKSIQIESPSETTEAATDGGKKASGKKRKADVLSVPAVAAVEAIDADEPTAKKSKKSSKKLARVKQEAELIIEADEPTADLDWLSAI